MIYDVVIIGGGPAGLTAGIYAKRAMLNTVLLEKMGVGGQIIVTELVENFPGFQEISGAELARKFEQQARKFGLETKSMVEVAGIEDRGKTKLVKTSEGDFETKTVIITTGTTPKKLGAKSELEFTGRGVSYCATCDSFFFRDKTVVVVGGGILPSPRRYSSPRWQKRSSWCTGGTNCAQRRSTRNMLFRTRR